MYIHKMLHKIEVFIVKTGLTLKLFVEVLARTKIPGRWGKRETIPNATHVASFEYPLKWSTYSAVWLLRGRCRCHVLCTLETTNVGCMCVQL